MTSDLMWMEQALVLAKQAELQGEVPVGAVLLDVGGQCVAMSSNAPISLFDPSAHAEICVLREAGQVLQNYRMPGATLYVTLEPCVMCFSALVHARIARLVYACDDPKSGAISRFHLDTFQGFNHRFSITSGVLAMPCSQLLKTFFEHKRKSAR